MRNGVEGSKSKARALLRKKSFAVNGVNVMDEFTSTTYKNKWELIKTQSLCMSAFILLPKCEGK